MVTRSEVIHRAATLWPTGTVPYSQSKTQQPTGYRQDCSGYISMCWGIPLNSGSYGGENTVTLVTEGWMHEIAPADLQPGDAVGICGPGSAGDAGHIVLFEKWLNDIPSDDHYWMWEQAGGQNGPIHRVANYPYGGPVGSWKAYRYRDITDTASSGGNTMSDYTPLGAPEIVKINGIVRGDSVLLADNWAHEMVGHSPYAPDKSYRGHQLDRIEAFAKAAAEQQPVVFAPETIQALATAVADAVTQDASAADIARELIAQLSPQSQT